MPIAGGVLVVLVALFLTMDAAMKIVGFAPAIEATTKLGFSASETRVLGLLLGVATALYVAPVTRLLGAIILTGYLGGAVAVQAQQGAPLASHVLFGVYVAVAAWFAVWLTSAPLRALVPLSRKADR